MKRREFGRVGSRPSRRSLASGLPMASRAARRSRGRTTSCSTPPVPSAGERQDRRDRVLLVRLPALQRVRADDESLAKEAAGRRGVRRVPVTFATSPSSRTSASTTRSRRWASSTRCTPRSSRRSMSITSALDNTTEIAAFMKKNGVDAAKFMNFYDGFRCRRRHARPRSSREPAGSTACRRSASQASARRRRLPARRDARSP